MSAQHLPRETYILHEMLCRHISPGIYFRTSRRRLREEGSCRHKNILQLCAVNWRKGDKEVWQGWLIDRLLWSWLLAAVTSLLGFTFNPSWREERGLRKVTTLITYNVYKYWLLRILRNFMNFSSTRFLFYLCPSECDNPNLKDHSDGGPVQGRGGGGHQIPYKPREGSVKNDLRM